MWGIRESARTARRSMNLIQRGKDRGSDALLCSPPLIRPHCVLHLVCLSVCLCRVCSSSYHSRTISSRRTRRLPCHRTDSTGFYSAQRLDSFAWCVCVRLSRLYKSVFERTLNHCTFHFILFSFFHRKWWKLAKFSIANKYNCRFVKRSRSPDIVRFKT